MRDATTIESHHLYRVVGTRIRELRQERGWSQLELSIFTGLTQCTISLLESGRQKRVRWATLEKLAGGLAHHRTAGLHHLPLPSDPSDAGPLGGAPAPEPAAVRRSPRAPAPRSAPAAARSPRLRALRAQPGARSPRGSAGGVGPIPRTPQRGPRESWHATARLVGPRTRPRQR